MRKKRKKKQKECGPRSQSAGKWFRKCACGSPTFTAGGALACLATGEIIKHYELESELGELGNLSNLGDLSELGDL